MRKMMVLSAAIVLAIGFAITAGSPAEAKDSDGRDVMYNGITVFDPVLAQACGSAAGGKSPDDGDRLNLYNGITYFNLGMPGSGARGSCAGGSGIKTSNALPGNGITVF